MAIGVVEDFLRRPGPEAAVQAHVDARRAALARRLRPLPRTARQPRRRPARALLRRPQARCFAARDAEPSRGPGSCSSFSARAVRQAAAGDRARSRPTATGWRSTCGQLEGCSALARSAASAAAARRCEGPARRHWAAFGAPKYGQQLKTMLDQFAGVFGGAAARAAAAAVRDRPRRGRPRAGSATSRSSCAATRSRRSTAAR